MPRFPNRSAPSPAAAPPPQPEPSAMAGEALALLVAEGATAELLPPSLPITVDGQQYRPAEIQLGGGALTPTVLGPLAQQLLSPTPESGHESLLAANAEARLAALRRALAGYALGVPDQAPAIRLDAFGQVVAEQRRRLQPRLSDAERALGQTAQALRTQQEAFLRAQGGRLSLWDRAVGRVVDLARLVQLWNHREQQTLDRDALRVADQTLARLGETIREYREGVQGAGPIADQVATALNAAAAERERQALVASPDLLGGALRLATLAQHAGASLAPADPAVLQRTLEGEPADRLEAALWEGAVEDANRAVDALSLEAMVLAAAGDDAADVDAYIAFADQALREARAGGPALQREARPRPALLALLPDAAPEPDRGVPLPAGYTGQDRLLWLRVLDELEAEELAPMIRALPLLQAASEHYNAYVVEALAAPLPGRDDPPPAQAAFPSPPPTGDLGPMVASAPINSKVHRDDPALSAPSKN